MSRLAHQQPDAVRHYRTRTRRTVVTSAIGVAALLLAVACSSTPAGSSKASSSGTAGTATGSTAVSKAQALLKYAASVAVTGPSTGVVPADQIVPWKQSLMPVPATLKTKKPISIDFVYDIPVGFGPYAAHVLQLIGAKLGWQVKVIAATAPTQPAALAAMDAAVLDKPTAIIASVIPATYDAPALAQAKAEGIHTILMHQDLTTGKGYDAYVPDGEGVQKALVAAYAIAQSNGAAKTMLVEAPGFSDVNMPAVSAYLAGCSGCTTQIENINPNDFVNPIQIQSDIAAKLATESGLGYMVWPDGGLPITTVLTAIAASPDKDTKLLVNDAQPADIQLLKAGQIPIVVEAPAALIVLAAVDDLIRMVQGQQPLAETALRFPVSYWTPGNSPAPNFSAITSAELKQGDWLSPYEKAWHIQFKSALLAISS